MGLSVFRVIYSGAVHFLYLNWNLFLAFILSNAPYILTDLFHLKLNSSMPVWLDLVLILSCAWTGLLFGFMSLWDIEKFLAGKMNVKLITLLSFILLFVGSFGIYIGRYLRWNSWDVIRKPQGLAYDIG